MPDFTIAELNEHPLAIYASESVAARDKVVAEIGRLKLVMEDDSLTLDERDKARADRLELISVLGRMDEADRAFLARVVVGEFGPKEEVVQRTIELNGNLGKVVAGINRATTIVRLVRQWTDALAAVVTGQAPSMPPVPEEAAPPSPSESPPASP
jgi:hypothetical protein